MNKREILETLNHAQRELYNLLNEFEERNNQIMIKRVNSIFSKTFDLRYYIEKDIKNDN